MPLPLRLLRSLQGASPDQAWSAILEYAWDVFSSPVQGKTRAEITARDRALASIDLFLATAGWDLWASYEQAVPRTADILAEWWTCRSGGRAVLILDGLSLREVPWILEQARKRGYTLHQARPTGAELPADTTPFTNALGLPSRSSLANNGAPASNRLGGARTDTVDLPWEDCVPLISPEPSWVLWHQWPDKRVHDLDGHGKGIDRLLQETRETLTGDAFWKLVERLSNGRRLVITADHGYAASGGFPDVVDPEQSKYLKRVYKAGRFTSGGAEEPVWVPPLDLDIQTTHGRYRFVLGRRKWKAQGGYPTLTHGGLTVLEVAVPFIEISPGPDTSEDEP